MSQPVHFLKQEAPEGVAQICNPMAVRFDSQTVRKAPVHARFPGFAYRLNPVGGGLFIAKPGPELCPKPRRGDLYRGAVIDRRVTPTGFAAQLGGVGSINGHPYGVQTAGRSRKFRAFCLMCSQA
jgi:hypothetical protein